MEWLTVTALMYRRVFARAAVLAFRNWPLLGTVFVYSFIMGLSVRLAGLLGPLGGFLIGLVWAACVGSFLYLVEMMVRTSRVTIEDFQRSFGAYLWDVVGIMFLLWIFQRLAAPALLQIPQGPVLLICAELAALVFFNAVPELIYLGHYSSLQLLSESYEFIGRNWVEWFPANLLVALLLVALSSLPTAGMVAWAQTAALALLVYFAMVMRGLLFLELHGSSRRGRAFRHRAGG
jgi:hypothetical protein